MHVFRCVLTRGIRWCFTFFLSFLAQKLFEKYLIFLKSNIFCLTCPGQVKMWPKVVKSDMVRFRTSRQAVYELGGKRAGGGNHPHPQVRSRMAKQEVRARVNTRQIMRGMKRYLFDTPPQSSTPQILVANRTGNRLGWDRRPATAHISKQPARSTGRMTFLLSRGPQRRHTRRSYYQFQRYGDLFFFGDIC